MATMTTRPETSLPLSRRIAERRSSTRSPGNNYNAGNALFRQNDFERAISEDQRAVHSSDANIQDRSYYSMGNAYVKSNQLREAANAYKSALRANPSDVDAKYNLEIIQRRLDQGAGSRAAKPATAATTAGKPKRTAGPTSGWPGPGSKPGRRPTGRQHPGRAAGYRATDRRAGGPAIADAGESGASGYTGTQAGQPENLDPALKRALDQFNQSGSVDDALQALDILGQQERLRQSGGGSAPRQPQGRDW